MPDCEPACPVYRQIYRALILDQARVLMKTQTGRANLPSNKTRRAAYERIIAYDVTVAVLIRERLPIAAAQLQKTIRAAQHGDAENIRIDAHSTHRIAAACAGHIAAARSSARLTAVSTPESAR